MPRTSGLKVCTKDLKKLEKRLKNLQENELDKFMKEAIMKLTSEFLQMVIEKTPRGNYSGDRNIVRFRTNPKENRKEVSFTTRDGTAVFFVANNPAKDVEFELKSHDAKSKAAKKQAGTLKGGWHFKDLKKTADGYEVEIYNDVYYAPWVENGHVKRNKKGGPAKGWVKGRFMMRDTELEIKMLVPEILENQLALFIKRGLG